MEFTKILEFSGAAHVSLLTPTVETDGCMSL